MDVLSELLAWFVDPAQWQGGDGIPARTLQHVGYSVSATVLATAIALPIGLTVGHTGKGSTVAINLANVGRAIPSFGIIILAFILAGIGLTAPLVALTALAIPPIVTNAYAGVRAVDPEVRESAEGMGLTGWQVLRDVEIPVAMPLIMAGVRTSAVQVVATATLAAFISLGGLGRYIFDGFATQDLAEVVGGAVLVAVLSLLVELVMSRLQALVTPEGIRDRDLQAGPAKQLQPQIG